MAFYTGRTGELLVANKPVAKVRDWSLDTTVDLLSTSTLEDFANRFIPGNKGATGSATLMYYRLETADINAGYAQFTDLLAKVQKVGAVTSADKVRMKLNVGKGLGTSDDIVFDAYITSASVSVATGELTTVPIQFTVDGDFIANGTIV